MTFIVVRFHLHSKYFKCLTCYPTFFSLFHGILITFISHSTPITPPSSTLTSPVCFFNNPRSPIYAITILNGYRISHWSMVHPVGTISLKKLFLSLPRNHKLSVDLRSRGFMSPSLFYTTALTCLLLCRQPQLM